MIICTFGGKNMDDEKIAELHEYLSKLLSEEELQQLSKQKKSLSEEELTDFEKNLLEILNQQDIAKKSRTALDGE